jgi:hypothetical protein
VAQKKARLEQLATQLQSIESRYPNGIPEPTYSQYVALASEYRTLAAATNDEISRYNALATEANAVRSQMLTLEHCYAN